MRIIINDKEVVFPSSLSEYTLGQRIAFQKEHGDLLDKMLDSILKMDDDEKRELEMVNFQLEKMFRTFAFFCNCSVEAVKEDKFVEDVANIYYACLSVLFEEEGNIKPQTLFTWKGEEWELLTPELQHGGKHRFGEFIDAKQVINDMGDIGRGKWEAMLPICAIYLRKKDEPYRQEFLYEGSERMELMKDLPMDIAMQVGFFLSLTTNSYLNTLRSSENQGSKELVSM